MRNIIWYNPPFSKKVKTNILKQFLHLLDKHFSKNQKYHKIFNRNNVKISYNCMDNMTNIISSHNKKVIISDNEKNKCLINKIVYKAEVETNDGINELSTKVDFGISETKF